MDIEHVRSLARSQGWVEVQHNAASRVLGFMRGDARVNVYYTTGTVGTCVDHPRQGRTQLFRRKQTLASLCEILVDPRVHTGVGYYRKHSASRPEPSVDAAPGGILYWLSNSSAMDYLEQRQWWVNDVQLVALWDDVFFLETGGERWWSGLPKQLDSKLRGRQRGLPPVDYVVLGPGGSYFVQFCDGHQQWSGPESLTDKLNEVDARVELLAFAPNDGWYVLWEDGASSWEGLPPTLHNQLNDRPKGLPGVEHLSIGEYGEWYVRFLNGSWRSSDLLDTLSKKIVTLQRKGKDIMRVTLGGRGSWVLEHS